MENNYTILVQGPLNPISLDNLSEYRKIGPIVISYWDTCDEELLRERDLSDCKLVKQPLPKDTTQGLAGKNNNTFVYAVASTYAGLREAETQYVVRTRSDERYNVVPLIAKFEQNCEKILCGSIIFRPWHDSNFHIGDHLFVGKKETLKSAYGKILSDPDNFLSCVPETVVTWAMLDAAGLSRTKEDFFELFDVIDINKLKPFVAKINCRHKTYIDHYLEEPGEKILTSMDENF